MIYLCAGLYAEGPSDYRFLQPLLNRHLNQLAAARYPSAYELADTRAIDARGAHSSRAARISAAIQENVESCTVFVVHADADGDAQAALTERVMPGVAQARAAVLDRPLPVVPCIPVREIEAWLLTDRRAFQALGSALDLQLPAAPEKERNPKATLERILAAGRIRPGPGSIHALFGENISLDLLRRLPAFQAFETALEAALGEAATAQGYRQPR